MINQMRNGTDSLAEGRRYFSLLDAIRGFAALLIVDRHTGLFQPLSAPMSFMAVDLFFLLSGVVIDASYRSRLAQGMTSSQFMWIRIARLYPLYIFGTAIAISAYYLSGKHVSIGYGPLSLSTMPLLHIMLSLFMIPAPFGGTPMFEFDSPAWSLFFELVVNLLYAIVLSKLKPLLLAAVVAFFGIALLGSIAHFHVVEVGYWSPSMYLAGVCRAGFSFFLGVGLYRLSEVFPIDKIRQHSGVVSVFVLATLIAVLAATPGSHQFAFYVLSVFFIFPALIFMSLPVKSGLYATKVWNFLGDMSYPVYALHVPVLIFFSSVLIVPYGQASLEKNLLVRAVYAVSMLIVAYIAMKTYDISARSFMRSIPRLWRRSSVSTADR